jgi:hypothetical protein
MSGRRSPRLTSTASTAVRAFFHRMRSASIRVPTRCVGMKIEMCERPRASERPIARDPRWGGQVHVDRIFLSFEAEDRPDE